MSHKIERIKELKILIKKWDMEDINELKNNILRLTLLCEEEEIDEDDIINFYDVPSNEIIKKYTNYDWKIKNGIEPGEIENCDSKGRTIVAIDNKGFALLGPGFSEIEHVSNLGEFIKIKEELGN